MPHTGLKFKIMLIPQSSHRVSIFGPDDFFPKVLSCYFRWKNKSDKKLGTLTATPLAAKKNLQILQMHHILMVQNIHFFKVLPRVMNP